MTFRVHALEADGDTLPSEFQFTKEDAQRAVAQALKWFGLMKKARVYLIKNEELVKKFNADKSRLAAMVRYHTDQSDFDVYFTEYTTQESLLMNAHHEVCHVYFGDLTAAIEHLENVIEKYSDSLALLATRRGVSRERKRPNRVGPITNS